MTFLHFFFLTKGLRGCYWSVLIITTQKKFHNIPKKKNFSLFLLNPGYVQIASSPSAVQTRSFLALFLAQIFRNFVRVAIGDFASSLSAVAFCEISHRIEVRIFPVRAWLRIEILDRVDQSVVRPPFSTYILSSDHWV